MLEIEPIQIEQARRMFERGVRAADFKPEDQAAPWLLEALRWLARDEDLTSEDMKSIVAMGGAMGDPDNTLHSADENYRSKLT